VDPRPGVCQFHEHTQEDWGCTVNASVCVNDLALDASTVKEPRPKLEESESKD